MSTPPLAHSNAFHSSFVRSLVDNLPCATKFQNPKTLETFYEHGYRLGIYSKGRKETYLNNHLILRLFYHKESRYDDRVDPSSAMDEICLCWYIAICIELSASKLKRRVSIRSVSKLRATERAALREAKESKPSFPKVSPLINYARDSFVFS